MTLYETFGPIDIYLFDQLLRGTIAPGMRVCDAGCGSGRNLVYLLRESYEVCANDADADAVAQVRALAAALAPGRPIDVRHEAIEHTSFPDEHVDVVLASAVLHFARDPAHFAAMVTALWRVLRPGGLWFARLASRDGLDASALVPRGNGRYLLPDGSERFLVDAATLLAFSGELGATLVDPLKTTLVHGQRSMTTWVLRKRAS